jgi:hypothetical protein
MQMNRMCAPSSVIVVLGQKFSLLFEIECLVQQKIFTFIFTTIDLYIFIKR